MSKVWNVTFLSVVALGILILATEPHIVNYERKHFGWVSLGLMAVAKNTHPGNSFVGYRCELEDGYKEYFSRFPVFFFVLTKYLLKPFESSSAVHLYLSRQLMNIVYVAIMGMMVLIARRFFSADARALLVALASGAGFLTLRFKNMYSYDPPSVLAFLMFLYILVRDDVSGLRRRRGRFLLLVALLSMIGRGHAVAFGCLVWMVFEALMGISRKNRGRIDWQRNLVLSVLALLVSAFTVAANIAFNVSVEARLNNVGLLETGIVDSAERRLGLGMHGSFSTVEFARQQLEAFSINSVPGILGEVVFRHRHSQGLVRCLAVLAFVCAVVGGLGFLRGILRSVFLRDYAQLNRERVLLIMSITGPAYLVAVRHWSHYHEFSAIYYLGSYLAFWIFVVGILNVRKAVWQALLLLFALLFIVSVADTREVNATIANPINYGELDAYAQFLAGRDSTSVNVEGGYRDFLPGSPNGMCYFLSPSKIAESPELADWTLTKQGEHYVLSREN